jgi:hypothetical protein
MVVTELISFLLVVFLWTNVAQSKKGIEFGAVAVKPPTLLQDGWSDVCVYSLSFVGVELDIYK